MAFKNKYSKVLLRGEGRGGGVEGRGGEGGHKRVVCVRF